MLKQLSSGTILYGTCVTKIVLLLMIIISNTTYSVTYIYKGETPHEVPRAPLSEYIPDTYVLSTLSYTADVPISEYEFFYLMDLKTGNAVCAADIERGLDLLWAKKTIAEIQVDIIVHNRNRISLQVRIIGRWYVRDVTITGCDAYIELFQQLYGDVYGTPFHEDLYDQLASQLFLRFKQEGFFDAAITTTYTPDDVYKAVDILLEVDLGNAYYISSAVLDLKGETIFDQAAFDQFAGELKQHVQMSLERKRYSQYLVEECLKKLNCLVFTHGYTQWPTAIQITLDRKKRQVHLAVSLQVKQKRIISFIGNKRVSSADLRTSIEKFGKSLWFVPAHIIADICTECYAQHGFIMVSIATNETSQRLEIIVDESKLEEKRDKKKREKPDFRFLQSLCSGTVTKSDQVQPKTGKCVLIGYTDLPIQKLFKALHARVPTEWKPVCIKESIVFLEELSIFKHIQVMPGACMKDNSIPLILRLQADNPLECKARAGLELKHLDKYHTMQGITYSVGGALTIKNPFDCGDIFSFDGNLTQVHHEVVMRYKMPWLFNTGAGMRLEGYSIMHKQPGFQGCFDNIYTFFQQGALGGLYTKKGRFEGGISCGLEIQETKLAQHQYTVAREVQIAQAMNFKPFLLNEKIPLLYFDISAFFDGYRDSPLYPTRGWYCMMTAKGMVPLSLNRLFARAAFLRIFGECAFFVTCMPRVVLAVRTRLGYLACETLSSIMPADRFFLGGSHSFRGSNADMVPPFGEYTVSNGHRCLVPQGGKTLMNGNIEIRFPIYHNFVSGVIFQDLGLLAPSDVYFPLNNLVMATGCGIRINTPVGPLRFDWGISWWRLHELQPRCAWFLTFGQAF